MKIPAERLVALVTLAKAEQVCYGDRDMFCIRDAQTSEVVSNGFTSKTEAKIVRDHMNEARRAKAKETRKHISHLVVSRGVQHWRGPSGTIVK